MDTRTRTRIIVAAELAAEGFSISAIAQQLDRQRETIGLCLKPSEATVRISGTTSRSSPTSRFEPDAATLTAELF